MNEDVLNAFVCAIYIFSLVIIQVSLLAASADSLWSLRLSGNKHTTTTERKLRYCFTVIDQTQINQDECVSYDWKVFWVYFQSEKPSAPKDNLP